MNNDLVQKTEEESQCISCNQEDAGAPLKAEGKSMSQKFATPTTTSYREVRALMWFLAGQQAPINQEKDSNCCEILPEALEQEICVLGEWLGMHHLDPSILSLPEKSQYDAISDALGSMPFESLDPLFQKLVTYSFENESLEQTQKFYQQEKVESLKYYHRFKPFIQQENSLEHNALLKFYLDQNANRTHHEVSCLAYALYKRLWPWLYDAKEEEGSGATKAAPKGCWEGQVIGYDVMNTFKTTDCFLLQMQRETTDASVRDNNEDLREYANLTHSFGNFTPIPLRIKFAPEEELKYFNYTRGDFEGPLKDYWDRSLVVLRQHFRSASPEDNLFERYINSFYLRGYSDGSEVYRYSQDIRLFPGYANKLIKTRGIVLIALLVLQKLSELK